MLSPRFKNYPNFVLAPPSLSPPIPGEPVCRCAKVSGRRKHNRQIIPYHVISDDIIYIYIAYHIISCHSIAYIYIYNKENNNNNNNNNHHHHHHTNSNNINACIYWEAPCTGSYHIISYRIIV